MGVRQEGLPYDEKSGLLFSPLSTFLCSTPFSSCNINGVVTSGLSEPCAERHDYMYYTLCLCLCVLSSANSFLSGVIVQRTSITVPVYNT